MSVQLDNLKNEVEATRTVEESAIVLLNGLSAQLAAIKDDPVAIQKLSDDLAAKRNELAVAISANS